MNLQDESKKNMNEANEESFGKTDKKIELKKETITAQISRKCCS